MAQGGEAVQGKVRGRTDVEVLAQFAEQLGLLDAVDAQIGLEIGVQLDDLRRIARVLHHKVHQKLLQLLRIQAYRLSRRRRRGSAFAGRGVETGIVAAADAACKAGRAAPPAQGCFAISPGSRARGARWGSCPGKGPRKDGCRSTRPIRRTTGPS